MRNEVAYDVVAYAAKATFSDLPESTVRVSKKIIKDTIGVAIAGSAASGCKEMASYINEVGGKPESTIFMFSHKVPNFQAAFVNGLMCNALDFDDTHEGAIVHTNASILPSAFATAETVGGISGKDFLVAYNLGIDFACRIALATGLNQGWHYTSICGYFGSTLASAKILGLNEKEMLNALGIVYSQIAGTHQPISDKALVKRMHPGLAARGGVFSAMLAKQGITGCKGIFEGEYGYLRKYEKGDSNIIRKDLGKVFEVNNISLKPYPSCLGTHGAITGTLTLVGEHNIRPDDVEEVELIISRYVNGLVGSPFEIGDNPQVEAQFSAAYTVAASITRRKFGIEELQETSIRDKGILELAKRVRCTVDDEIKTHLAPVTVKIQLRNGDSVSHKVEILKGNPANPTTEEEDADKFNECVQFGIKKLSEERRDKLIGLILSLEQLGDVREIMEYLK